MPSSISSGNHSVGTVTLSGPAPAEGILVNLTGSRALVSLPNLVTVASGASTATFNVDALNVTKTTSATIKASLSSVTKTAPLTITPATLSRLFVNPSAVTGGSNSTGNVVFSGPVAKSTTITLSSSSPSVVLPNTVTLDPGDSSIAFTISTSTVIEPTPVTITAKAGDQSQKAVLAVDPEGTIASISLTAPAEVGGTNNVYTSVYGVVNLATPAGNDNVTVSLSSSDPSVTVPSTITIDAGATSSSQFYVDTRPVTKDTVVTITAKANSSTKSTLFYVDVPFLLTTTPESVIGGQSSTGRITIQSTAPTGGATFTLSCYGSGISVPPTATIPAGAKTVTFPITTTAAANVDVYGWIYAADPSCALLGTPLMVNGSWAIQNVWLSPQAVSAGASTSLTVVLNGPAPAGGEVVNISAYNYWNSSYPACVTVPPKVTVPAGQSSLVVPISTTSVSIPTTASISATIGTGFNFNTSVQLEITPAVPGITYTLLNPTNATSSAAFGVSSKVQGGSASNLTASHAGIWKGRANSFTDLNPANWADSAIAGVSGNLQVGTVSNTLNMQATHAAAWQGNAESFVDLNPPGAAGSSAYGVSGGTIVGSVLVPVTESGQTNQISHASLWAVTSSNYIDLDPNGSGSAAYAVDGNAVVGSLGSQAALWPLGTAASYVSLQPPSWNHSIAYGVSGNTQVGSVFSVSGVNFTGPHASLWTGTAASFWDLHPMGPLTSQAFAVSGDIVVGTVNYYPYGGDGVYPVHAAMWSGNSLTFIDLVAAVGASWENSSAKGVYSDSTGIYIVGTCDEGAILWHIPAGVLPRVPSRPSNDRSKPK